MSAAAMPMSCPPTAELIAAVQRADSSQGLLLATQALAACADPAAASTLVEVLGFNNPGAAVAAVDGLIHLGPGAVDALLQLDPENYGARAWAVRARAGRTAAGAACRLRWIRASASDASGRPF
jgi:phycocyanobilin lyase beta subunit